MRISNSGVQRFGLLDIAIVMNGKKDYPKIEPAKFGSGARHL
jgi:hypothetical protein